MSPKTVKLGSHCREGALRQREGRFVDDNGRFDFVFSSEEKIFRRDLETDEPFYETLDHSHPDSMDRRRIDNGTVVLDFNHGKDVGKEFRTIGRVEDTAILPEEGIGVGTAVFDTDEASAFAQGKVSRGMWRGISAEYIPGHYIPEGTHKGLPHRRNVGWQLIRVAVQPGQADVQSHVLQSRENEYVRDIEIVETDMAEKETQQRAAEPAKSADGGGSTVELLERVRLAESAADRDLEREVERATQIRELQKEFADNPEISKLGDDAVADRRVSFAQYAAQVARIRNKRGDTVPENKFDIEDAPQVRKAEDVGMSDGDKESYKFMRVVEGLYQFQKNGVPLHKTCGFELEISNDFVQRNSLDDATGLIVPPEMLDAWSTRTDAQKRALETQMRAPPMSKSLAGTQGANLVGTDHMGFIEHLYANSVVLASGAQTMTGLVGDVQIPRQESQAPAEWMDPEDTDATDQEITVGLGVMQNRTIMSAVPITRRLMQQSSPGVEQMVRNDLTRVIGLGIDVAALSGDGTSFSPTGVTNTAGVAGITIASAGNPTWAEIVDFWESVAGNDAAQGALRYVTTPAVVGNMMTTIKDSSGADGFIANANSSERGALNVSVWPLSWTSQLAANTIIFGNWSDVMIGFWGGLDLNVDVSTKAASGGVVLRAFQDADVLVRRSASFAINA